VEIEKIAGYKKNRKLVFIKGKFMVALSFIITYYEYNSDSTD